MKRAFALVLTLMLLAPAAEARRRAVRPGSGEVPQDPAGWLAARAYVLQTVEYPAPSTADLQPLRAIAGDASVVALSDGTHGTREFYTIKQRMIDFLVREMDFDVVAFEAPLPSMDSLDRYINGEPVDVRAVLADLNNRLGYRFWDVEEMLSAMDMLRDYNAHRGDRRAVRLAGFDVFDATGTAAAVVAYLMTVDPAAAIEAERQYTCTLSSPSAACSMSAAAIRDRLEGRRNELEPANPQAFEIALQNARVVVQSQQSIVQRDGNMATNVLWTLEHRSETGRVVLWAHGEHSGRTLNEFVPGDPMGVHLDRALGRDYVVIGMLTGGGTFRQWEPVGAPAKPKTLVSNVPVPPAGSYESNFKLGPGPAMLIPLRGDIPPWLAGPATFFTAGTAPTRTSFSVTLPAKFDAVVYIDATRETTPLQP